MYEIYGNVELMNTKRTKWKYKNIIHQTFTFIMKSIIAKAAKNQNGRNYLANKSSGEKNSLLRIHKEIKIIFF